MGVGWMSGSGELYQPAPNGTHSERAHMNGHAHQMGALQTGHARISMGSALVYKNSDFSAQTHRVKKLDFIRFTAQLDASVTLFQI